MVKEGNIKGAVRVHAWTSKTYPVTHTEAEWRKILTPEQYEVMREHGTEAPGSCALNYEKRAGTFTCAGCGQKLFVSKKKFESGTGWPSFNDPEPGAVETSQDRSYGMVRTEVHCSRCGSHLGHVFDDGPPPTASALLHQRRGDEFQAGPVAWMARRAIRALRFAPDCRCAPNRADNPPSTKEGMMLQETIEQGVDLETARWQARVDLAAAHRLCVMHGFNEGIFNHLTFRVPGTNDRYYQIPFGLYWSEVTASCFMEVGYDGERLSGEGDIERSCYCIHAPIHRLAQHAGAVFHTHMPFASALTRLKDQRILPIGQTEVAIAMHTAYDDSYGGPAFDPAEGERLAGIVGNKKILMMANHGVATITPTISEAFDLLYYTERAAQVQIYAMQTRARAERAAAARDRRVDRGVQDRAAIRQQEAACLALRGA